MELKDKVALLTGTASPKGLGKAIIDAFANEGAKIATLSAECRRSLWLRALLGNTPRRHREFQVLISQGFDMCPLRKGICAMPRR
jgi:NAD(P)-dependent dehydrogenase (short-subunit alcohol dehydrogenase family)